ncbi:MAG: tRNA (adenosine(37)-N6)-threonylcarbamoyltransferase complex dimerization subunit type 1 TsaB [Ignavibacteria bacterium]
MNVLGIETATMVCGAAVAIDGLIIAEQSLVEKNVHAEQIIGLIDTVLKRSALQPRQLDVVAVSIGPGSFTGLRIGLSVAKGLCYALEKPLVAVPTLEALAWRAFDARVVRTLYLLPALDARRDEVYCTLYRTNGTMLRREWDVRAMTVRELVEATAGLACTITGDARSKVALQLPATQLVPDALAMCSAGAVARLGAEMAQRNEFADVRSAEPAYVKEVYTTTKQ